MVDLIGFFKLSRDLSLIVSRNLSEADVTIAPVTLALEGNQMQRSCSPQCVAQVVHFSSVGLDGLCGAGKYSSSHGERGEVIFCRALGRGPFREAQPRC